VALVKSSPSDELQELVENINAALNSIQKNGQHIMGWAHTIKTKELWRQTEAKSFSQFCEMQSWTVRRFDQLASGYAVLLTIPEETRTIVPTEGAARELGKVAETKREKAVKETEKRDGKVTAKGLSKTRQSSPEYEPTEPAGLSEPKEKEVVRDELGWPIPADLIPFWERRWILENMMKLLSDLKCEIEKGWKDQDPLFLQMSNTTVSELQGVRWSVKHARPWAVCTLCEGRPKLNVACAQCNSTGFILERLCETAPTVKDVLKIRAKILEKQKAE